uniref:30S ribosomal protein S17 n=1 Tax=candidate division CPR3 bacterium TaxID=2268181 RepID=A0A7C4M0W8_UNCC3
MRITKQGTVKKRIDQRTVAVETFLMKTHPIYKKRFKVVKKYLADDRDIISKEGDIVVIEECRPISKTKYFKVIKKLGSTIIGEDKIVGEEVLGAEEKEKEESEKNKEENND